MQHPALQIILARENDAFKPGEVIAGVVRWVNAPIGGELAAELKWSTRGKGSVDRGTDQTMTWPIGQSEGETTFQFNAPKQPLSFEGRIVGIYWVVTARIRSKKAQIDREIVISPRLTPLSVC
jgi:hypothetical protein